MRKLSPSEWHKISSDQWILNTIEFGYEIEFCSKPIQRFLVKEISFSVEEADIVSLEVQKLLDKGAINRAVPRVDQFISNIFLVPKKDGSKRPVINLRQLNDHVSYYHFKQENLVSVCDLIQKNDYLCSIDLTDAYFSIGIHESCRHFLRFTWKGELFEFKVLAFGLASAPRVFTKVLKPVYAFFRQHGIRCIYYIDDSLNMNQDVDVCRRNTEDMVTKLENLGFSINFKKSVLVPAKRIVFFGLILDSELFRVFLTPEKLEKIISFGNFILKKDKITIRALSSFIGLIVHACYGVAVGRLHYRTLEREKVLALQLNAKNFDADITLSCDSKAEIQWWVQNLNVVNGKPIRPQAIDCWIETDASLLGWGTKYDDKCTGGRWSIEESFNHINYLELLAIWFSLKSFFDKESNLHIGIKSDSVTAIAFVNDQGGMSSSLLNKLAIDIWNWCFKRNLFITAQFIPGIENVSADKMSRNFSDSKEWQLKPDIFIRICNHFCIKPDIDLFASRLNHQLPVFVSWSYDPQASNTDAFTIPWSLYKPYIFPPYNLIGKIVQKILCDKVDRALLVVPFWPTQNWFPLLMSILISLPARIPQYRDLLKMPHSGELHPLHSKMHLIGCVVSGRDLLISEFRESLQMLSPSHGGQELSNNTNWHGKNTLFGVIRGKKIPFVRLKR